MEGTETTHLLQGASGHALNSEFSCAKIDFLLVKRDKKRHLLKGVSEHALLKKNARFLLVTLLPEVSEIIARHENPAPRKNYLPTSATPEQNYRVLGIE